MNTANIKDEFRNETQGFVGVITIDNGKERGVAVRPESTIWLSEQEQILTANAPRRDEDNPFINGQLKLVTKAQDVKNRRPLGNEEPSSNGDAASVPAATPGPQVEPVAEPVEVAPPEPQTARQREDRERVKAEAERKAAADAQANAGAVPGAETGAALSAAGVPKPKGTSAANEEVATPDAPAKAEEAAAKGEEKE